MRLLEFTKAINLLEKWIEQAQLQVPYYVCSDAPNTYKSMIESRNKHGMFFISNKASGKTIYSNKKYNIMFRAIHDKMHYDNGLSFSFKDEKKLSDLTEQKFLQWCLDNDKNLITASNSMKIIHCEIAGQISYYEKNKKFVEDQLTFALDFLNVK